MTKILSKIIASFVLIIFVLSVPLWSIPPQGIKHLASIEQVDNYNFNSKGQSHIDIEETISGIPYKLDNRESVYSISPLDKYQSSIVNGLGNCSNFAYGLAYELLKNSHPFDIIYLLPKENFLSGGGHTVIHTSFILEAEKKVGIIDLFEGGIPLVKGEVISPEMLRNGKLDDFSFESLNNQMDSIAPYYLEYLNDCTIGLVSSQDLNKYFALSQRLSFLPDTKISKMIVDGVAIIFNWLPKTKILKEDIHRLLNGNGYLMILIKALRILILLCVLCTLLLLIFKWRLKRIN